MKLFNSKKILTLLLAGASIGSILPEQLSIADLNIKELFPRSSESTNSLLKGPKLGLRPAPVKAYREALSKSAEMPNSPVLNPITPWNEKLIWKNNKVKMVTLVSAYVAEKYLSDLKANDTYATTRDTWVTPFPDLKNFCNKNSHDISPTTVNLRVRQLLGLPRPNKDDKFFIMEIYVNPADLFRPCMDSGIVDNVCVPPAFNNPYRKNQWKHQEKDYFSDKEVSAIQSIYKETHGDGPWEHYPFTGVGYTYDWNPHSNHIGASEYVLENGSKTVFESLTPLEDYCK